MGDYRLAGLHFQFPIRVSYSHTSAQDDCELVKFWGLARFRPPFWTAHVGDTHGGTLAVDVANVFVNEFGFSPGGLDASGLSQKRGHAN
jgi:hypothetical protein